MSDNRSRHDRLAVRLSLIISRLMAGESLSLKTLSDEFGVTIAQSSERCGYTVLLPG